MTHATHAPAYVPTITEPVTPTAPRTGTRASWTPRERQVIREHYLRGGTAACAALLPARSKHAISEQARRLGLRRQKPHAAPQPSSEWIDAELRRFYGRARTASGELKALSQRLGRSRQWIYSRARAIGAIVGRIKPPNWLQEEDDILHAHEGKGLRAIQKRLAAAGYRRSAAAITARLYDHGLSARVDDPDLFTANQLASAMRVDSKQVCQWIERGWLRATRDGSGASAWRIRRRDVRRFLIEHIGRWDHQRIEQYWLVEMLAGSLPGAG